MEDGTEGGNSWSTGAERVQKEAWRVEEEEGRKDMSLEKEQGHLQGQSKGVGGN